MTYYKLMDRCVLQVRVISLLKELPAQDFFCEIADGDSLNVKVEKIDAKIEQVSLKFPPVDGKEIPEFPMKLDFHLREFLAAVGCKNTDL